jgi:hypothetical protein
MRTQTGQKYYSGVAPKNMVTCNKEHYLEVSFKYGLDPSREDVEFTNRHILYARHIDQRYFFHWFGEQYWLLIPEAEFAKATAGCVRHTLPHS